MSPEQGTALIAAITALVIAVGGVLAQLRQTHALLNGRMTQLIAETKLASQKTGELDGRDLEVARAEAARAVAAQSASPTGQSTPNT